MATKSAKQSKTTLYALGSNGNFQLGIGHDNDVASPQKCRFMTGSLDEVIDHVPLRDGEQIRKIVAGGNHTLLLTTLGTVWATGRGEAGQCGWDESGSEQVTAGTWRKVQWCGQGQSEAFAFTDVAATWNASYFVVDDHIICSCGQGDKGELGIGLRNSDNPLPTRCFDLRDFEADAPETKIESVSACMNHVVVLSSSRKLYGWGACRKGQLGAELKDKKVVWLPELLSIGLDWAPRQLATGREFTLLVGDRPEQQCFLGSASGLGFESPFRFEAGSPQSFEVHTGWTHVVVRSSDGRLWNFGRGTRGQLLENQPEQRIASLVMGSEHSLAVTDRGSVIAWGWGEHGNCGVEDDEKKNAKGGYNTLFMPKHDGRVTGIGAGCATSFFWIEAPYRHP